MIKTTQCGETRVCLKSFCPEETVFLEPEPNRISLNIVKCFLLSHAHIFFIYSIETCRLWRSAIVQYEGVKKNIHFRRPNEKELFGKVRLKLSLPQPSHRKWHFLKSRLILGSLDDKIRGPWGMKGNRGSKLQH